MDSKRSNTRTTRSLNEHLAQRKKKKKKTKPVKAKDNLANQKIPSGSSIRYIRSDLCNLTNARDNFVVVSEPYKVSKLENLFIAKDFVDQMRKDVLQNIELHEKNNDLYKFKQSKDIIEEIKTGKFSSLSKFIQLIKQVVRPAIEKDIGLDLDPSHIDMTVSRYDCGDYLLCHNDDIKRVKNHGRLVAFIYYLVDRPWNEDDGGSLQVLSCHHPIEKAPSSLYPASIEHCLHPKPNTFVYFRTTEMSWHAVEEVKNPKGCRLSINGWFHGSRKQNKAKEAWEEIDHCPLMRPLKDKNCMDKLFLKWINHDYMMEKTWKRISKTFSDTSEISLTDFLAKDKYDKLCEALRGSIQNKKNHWKIVGPLNLRHYKRADLSQLPKICRELISIFQSNLFFLMLSKVTGLDLENDNDDTETSELLPNCRIEFRSWQKRFYTLINDLSEENNESNALDCILHFNHDSEVDHDRGGFISYIAKGEDEELLTVEPKSNCLSLVYRDSETARFVKYLSDSHNKDYQDLSCVYYPKPSNDSSSYSDSSIE